MEMDTVKVRIAVDIEAYQLNAAYFYLFSEANIGALGIGMNRVQQWNKRGNEQ